MFYLSRFVPPLCLSLMCKFNETDDLYILEQEGYVQLKSFALLLFRCVFDLLDIF